MRKPHAQGLSKHYVNWIRCTFPEICCTAPLTHFLESGCQASAFKTSGECNIIQTCSWCLLSNLVAVGEVHRHWMAYHVAYLDHLQQLQHKHDSQHVDARCEHLWYTQFSKKHISMDFRAWNVAASNAVCRCENTGLALNQPGAPKREDTYTINNVRCRCVSDVWLWLDGVSLLSCSTPLPQVRKVCQACWFPQLVELRALRVLIARN